MSLNDLKKHPAASKKPVCTRSEAPSLEKIRALKKQVKNVQRRLGKESHALSFDNLRDLSEDDSYSSSREEELADLGNSENEEELFDDDDDESDSFSRSINSEDDLDSEEQRLRKKRKIDTVVPAKMPRSQFNQAREQLEKEDAEREAKTERLNQLINTTSLNIREYERIKEEVDTATKNLETRIAVLEEKEKESLFVIDCDRAKKNLDIEEASLKQRLDQIKNKEAQIQALHEQHFEEVKARQDSLDQRSAGIKDTEASLSELSTKIKAKLAEIEQKETELKAREEHLEKAVVENKQLEASILEEGKELSTKISDLAKREKALLEAKPVVNTKPANPLESFIAEMHRTGHNLLTKEEMLKIVPLPLQSDLAYLSGKQPLKYQSIGNNQFLILEVSNKETGQILLQNVVSKQLFNSK